MNFDEPLQFFYNPKKTRDDINTTKRSLVLHTLNNSTIEPSAKNLFVPFVQERDHLGRLLKSWTDSNTSGSYRNTILNNKSSPYSPSTLTKSSPVSYEKLPPINQGGSKSLFKLAEKNLYNEAKEAMKSQSYKKIDHNNISSNLYFIKSGGNNTLEVEHSTTRTNKNSSGVIAEPKGRYNSLEIETSAQIDYDAPNSKIMSSDRLPPINIYTLKESFQVPLSASSKSFANIANTIELQSGCASLANETSALMNPTVWRYEADQISQNKEVQKMLKKEPKKGKTRNRIDPLNIQDRYGEGPSSGSYQPSLDAVKSRVQNCIIQPLPLTKLEIQKLKQAKIDEIELQKMRNASLRAQEEKEEKLKEQNYYNSLFKDMLKEAHAKQKKNKKIDQQKLAQAKKLDYIVLEDFKRFPTDFETKLNKMKIELRGMKDRLYTNKEANETNNEKRF